MKRVRKKRFPDETQNLKTLMRLLLLVVAAKLMLVNAKADGCYCRVESISLSTNWWKMGFVNPGWPTNPPEVCLERTTGTKYQANDWLDPIELTSNPGIIESDACMASGLCEAYDLDHDYSSRMTLTLAADSHVLKQAWRADLRYESTNGVSTVDTYSLSEYGQTYFGTSAELGGISSAIAGLKNEIGDKSARFIGVDLWNCGSQVLYLAKEFTEETHFQFDCMVNNGVFYNAEDPTACHHSEQLCVVYNAPFTDALLAKKISSLMARQTWPTNWVHNDLVVASYLFGDTNHISASGKKSFYRPEVPDSQTNVTYTLQWEQVTQVVANNTTNTTRQLMGCQIIGTGDKVNPAIYDPPFFVDVPLAGNTTVYITAPEIVTPASPLTPGSGP